MLPANTEAVIWIPHSDSDPLLYTHSDHATCTIHKMEVLLFVMHSHQSSAELKASAKEHMFGRYGSAIGVHLMVSFITVFATLSIVTFTVNTATLIGTIIHYVLLFAISVFTGLLSSGTAYFYLKIVTGQHATANDLFCGFRMYTDKALTVQAWISLITYICSLPEYIVLYRMSERPDAAALTIYGLCMLLSGIVSLLLAVFYAPAFFLLHDFPQYTAKELLTRSRKLMSGNKGRLFYIYLSYIPFLFLGTLSCGIALLWVIPYMNATLAEFYMDIIRNRSNRTN